MGLFTLGMAAGALGTAMHQIYMAFSPLARHMRRVRGLSRLDGATRWLALQECAETHPSKSAQVAWTWRWFQAVVDAVGIRGFGA